jgi:hypothetical protein
VNGTPAHHPDPKENPMTATTTEPAAAVGHRETLRRRLAAVPALRAKVDQLQAGMAARNQQLEDHIRRERAAILGMRAEVDALGAEIARGQAGEGELLRTCPDHSLLAADRRIGAEMLAIEERIRALAEAVQFNTAQADDFRRRGAMCEYGEDRQAYEARAKSADAAAEARAVELAASHARRAALTAERAELDKRKLLA